MQQPRTLRDHFAAGLGQANGRLARLCNLTVDGIPLGDYAADAARTPEERKRFEEMQWLGIALVGCDADLDLQQVRYVGRAPSMPDLEGVTNGGHTVRIEVSRIIFGDEMEQNKYFATIAGLAQQHLTQSAATAMEGKFIYRAYESAGPISRVEAEQCAHEMANFITNDSRLRRPSTSMYNATDQTRYPLLARLGVYVCHSELDAPVTVLWDPMIEPSDPHKALEQFSAVRRQKAGKIAAYSGGGIYPVWLVCGALSLRQHFVALTLVQHLAECEDIDPAPFARVLVGCYTAGVTFERVGQRPKYTSLTTTG